MDTDKGGYFSPNRVRHEFDVLKNADIELELMQKERRVPCFAFAAEPEKVWRVPR